MQEPLCRVGQLYSSESFVHVLGEETVQVGLIFCLHEVSTDINTSICFQDFQCRRVATFLVSGFSSAREREGQHNTSSFWPVTGWFQAGWVVSENQHDILQYRHRERLAHCKLTIKTLWTAGHSMVVPNTLSHQVGFSVLANQGLWLRWHLRKFITPRTEQKHTEHSHSRPMFFRFWFWKLFQLLHYLG